MTSVKNAKIIATLALPWGDEHGGRTPPHILLKIGGGICAKAESFGRGIDSSMIEESRDAPYFETLATPLN